MMAQLETIRKIRLDVVRREKKVRTVPKREKRRYRRNYRNVLRARVRLSRLIRDIDYTEPVRQRLIDGVKENTEGVQRIRRELVHLDRQVKATTRRRIKDEEKLRITRRQRELRPCSEAGSRGGSASSGPCSEAGPRRDGVRWGRCRGHRARQGLLHRIPALVPVDRAVQGWQAGLHDGAPSDREPGSGRHRGTADRGVRHALRWRTGRRLVR